MVAPSPVAVALIVIFTGAGPKTEPVIGLVIVTVGKPLT